MVSIMSSIDCLAASIIYFLYIGVCSAGSLHLDFALLKKFYLCSLFGRRIEIL